MLHERTSGVLLHPTSLPGRFGIGDLGPEAYRFVDWLAGAAQTWWQVLPLSMPGPDGSPYQSPSSFAGNPALISPELLLQDGLLTAEELDAAAAPAEETGRVDFDVVHRRKMALLNRAAATFHARAGEQPFCDLYGEFCAAHADWLQDHALFMALREANDYVTWRDWSRLVDRRKRATSEARRELAGRIEAHQFFQWLFYRQWKRLRQYARERGVFIMGDLPIYVAEDSADVWANREFFQLDALGRPTHVAGVPPDYFSATGQLWQNPLYDWEALRQSDYAWWVRRVRALLELVDIARIDHFRGFEAYWSVAAGEPTAEHGAWVPGPGAELFEAMRRALLGEPASEMTAESRLPFVAEDLGLITAPVTVLRKQFRLPGMKVLHFVLPSPDEKTELERDVVVYTGTHDNDTTVGWYRNEIAQHPERIRLVRRYTPALADSIAWELIELAWRSDAGIAMAPLQDILSLDSEARMNRPGTTSDQFRNWSWRFRAEMLTEEIQSDLANLTRSSGRASRG